MLFSEKKIILKPSFERKQVLLGNASLFIVLLKLNTNL